jgi:dihydroorotate dehydrogenase/Pyruvate/2-oxoacid:ferredoxin oxidoreductase delta subunit
MGSLTVEYGEVEFKNPIVAAAGPLGRTFEALKRSIEAGCGAVTLKSNNATPGEAIEPRPSAHILARPAHVFLQKYRLKNMMINWEGVPVEFSAEEQRKMIERIRPLAREHDCRVIANMHPDPMYVQDMDMFRRDVKTILSAGPDMIEFCICPYHVPPEVTYPDTQDYDQIDGMLKLVYAAVMEIADVPVIAKHNGPIFSRSAKTLTGIGVRHFHVTEGPLFYGTVIDIDSMRPLAPGPAVITYGAHRRPVVNLQCARTRSLGTDFDVMSSSGVWSAGDAIERMMCGARLVGLHTAIQYHGHKLFAKIIEGLDAWLDGKGMELDEIVGRAVPQIVSQEAHDAFMRERDRSADQIEPEIDLDACNGCGVCANCIHGGISMRDEEPRTHLDLCVRCGVCESICPTDAITMQVQ